MENYFELCKSVSALNAAEKQGIPVKRKARRAWTCCPIHHEKSPSLCFYEDGSWHCFGCHHGGDSVAFYAAYMKITPLDAAKRLAEDFQLVPSIPDRSGNASFSSRLAAKVESEKSVSAQARELMEKVEAWKATKQRLYADIIHKANTTMRRIEESLTVPDLCWDNSDFTKALYARQAAENELDILSLATPRELFQMMKESGS